MLMGKIKLHPFSISASLFLAIVSKGCNLIASLVLILIALYLHFFSLLYPPPLFQFAMYQVCQLKYKCYIFTAVNIYSLLKRDS